MPPLFTARLDRDRATVRARGRLDHVSADLLRGAVETLQRHGHRHITIDIAGLFAHRAPVGDLLAGMVAEMSAAGTQLTLRHDLPPWPLVPTASPASSLGLVREPPRSAHQ